MATTEDPIVLYIVVKDSLNMNKGKVAAQAGHAVQNILLHYFKIQVLSVKKDLNLFSQEELNDVKVITEWIDHGSTKVVLKANDDQFKELKEQYGKISVVVKDAGKTEVAPGTETVLAIWPHKKSFFTGVIKEMSLLR